jgi:hypothetical protein
MVVIFAPFGLHGEDGAGLFTDMPSRSTVQAPQCAGFAADMRAGELQVPRE